MTISAYIRLFLPLLLLSSLATGAESVTGQLKNKSWTAKTAEIAKGFPPDESRWVVRLSAGETEPGLTLSVPRKVGVHPFGGIVRATMFVPPGENEAAKSGTIEVVSIGERVELKVDITVNDTDKVAGTISFLVPKN